LPDGRIDTHERKLILVRALSSLTAAIATLDAARV
jgi:hypothetical protein